MAEPNASLSDRELKGAIAEALAASQSLIALLKHEGVLIADGRFGEIGAFSQRKDALRQQIDTHAPALQRAGRDAIIAAGGEPLIRHLRALAAATQGHLAALQGAIIAHDRLIGTIREASAAARGKRYGREGEVCMGRTNAIALNNEV